MARTKHKKINEVNSFENVFDFNSGNTEEELLNKFDNTNTVSLEIGCGEGDYTISLAKLFPKRNFIGIDFKGARIYFGAKKALEEKIFNAAFLWINAEHLSDFFNKEKIEEIFITFPEPHVKRRAEKKRLVSPRFLEIYRQILMPGGHVHLKTDDVFLYNYAMEVLTKVKAKILFNSDDLYSQTQLDEIKTIKTRYEKYYLTERRKIKYIEFVLS